MPKSIPPLTWFRSFEAAARHLSFTAAAKEIGLTQSAVSQQVKSLEKRLCVPLFERHARGLALTDHGRQLLPEVGAPLEALAAAAGKFDLEPGGNFLTVATSISVAQWVIAPNLPAFSLKYPDIRIRFLSAIWPDDFHTARADVEVRFGSAKQVGKGAEPLQPHRLVALKSPSLEGELHELPLIEAVGTSSGWRGWTDAFGAEMLRPTFYTDTYGMALQLAAHGNGVALVGEWLAKHAIRSSELEPAHPGSVPCQEGYFLSVTRENEAAVRFRDWLLGLSSH
ncbi:MAG: LysR family transcriptional regulator [Pseudomonadota bacterium]